MVSLKSLLVAASAASAASISVREPGAMGKRTDQSGWSDGYYYSFWSDDQDQVTFINMTGGKFAVTWEGHGNFVAGMGWNPGKARVITFSRMSSPDVNGGQLFIYGVTRNPLAEYNIIENFGTYDPSSAASLKGSITVDGSNYRILETVRTDQPSIQGTSNLPQYWSVRQNRRNSGSVDVGAHFNAWASLGMELGSHHYQLVVIAGDYNNSGSAYLTVGSNDDSGGGDTNPDPTISTLPTQTATPPDIGGDDDDDDGCSALWGQCGGTGWTGPTCCSSGSCQSLNNWYSQCI